jgi:glucose/arabinose dehydrogenase
LPVSAGTGPNPEIPPPAGHLIPTVNIVPAKGWATDGKPMAAEGTAVALFADNLDHPRWLFVLPNGDVLVAETNVPSKPDDFQGLKGWITKMIMKKAAAGGKSAKMSPYSDPMFSSRHLDSIRNINHNKAKTYCVSSAAL